MCLCGTDERCTWTIERLMFNALGWMRAKEQPGPRASSSPCPDAPLTTPIPPSQSTRWPRTATMRQGSTLWVACMHPRAQIYRIRIS